MSISPVTSQSYFPVQFNPAADHERGFEHEAPRRIAPAQACPGIAQFFEPA